MWLRRYRFFYYRKYYTSYSSFINEIEILPNQIRILLVITTKNKYNTKNYGRLSIISNWKLKITKHFDVSKSCFYPKPKVESSILSFVPETKYIKFQNEESLQVVTRIFFAIL